MDSSTGQSVGSLPRGAHFESLDGLRGLAVLAVVMFHTLRIKGEFGLFGAIWGRFQYSTWAGVDLFFVLSGFLITGILLDSRNRTGYFKTFYARRTLRIFPLYYAVLIVALLIVPAVVGFGRLPFLYHRLLENQIWMWTYMQNYLQARSAHTLPGFGHFWSLAVEEQFYWFWPVVVYLASRKRLLQICIAACLLLPVVRLALVLSGDRSWAIRQYTRTRFDSLLYGAIVAIVVRDSGLLRKSRRFAVAAAVVAATVLLGIAVQDGFVPYEAPETLFLGYSAFAAIFSVLIGYLVTRQSRLSHLLSTKSLRWLGTYSYGIYVFHWPVTQAYQAVIEPRLILLHSPWFAGFSCLFTVLAISSVIAYGSFVLFESKFLKLKRYFVYSETVGGEKQRTTAVPEFTGPVVGA